MRRRSPRRSTRIRVIRRCGRGFGGCRAELEGTYTCKRRHSLRIPAVIRWGVWYADSPLELPYISGPWLRRTHVTPIAFKNNLVRSDLNYTRRFFSFSVFVFAFLLRCAFFCCSFLPLSFFPLSPISISPYLKMTCVGLRLRKPFFDHISDEIVGHVDSK